MDSEWPTDFIISPADTVLVTGATGFVGPAVVGRLLERGARNVRCLARRSSDVSGLEALAAGRTAGRVAVVRGNLLSPADCDVAAEGAAVIFHLATSRNGKSYPDTFLNSVVTTRNLLEAAVRHGCLRRFVNVSSLAVYTNRGKPGRRLDERCSVEIEPVLRGDAYCYAKVKQDEIVQEYASQRKVRSVTVRPGYVYGPGKDGISSRVGIGTFGVFLHLGGGNTLPLTYVQNCAEAIVLAGLEPGIDGEVFNVVDDNLPTSRRFLRLYKRHVRRFRSIYVPHVVSYWLCCAWERYSAWSHRQLPPTFNRRHWHAYWKQTTYSNEKVKASLGWAPRISTSDGLRRYFEACAAGGHHA